MNAKALNAKGAFALLKETYTEWSKDNCMRLGAALAYYSVFSAAPLIMIAIGIVGAIYGEAAAQGRVAEQLGTVVGPQVAEAIQGMVQNASKTSKGATIIGVVTLIVGASGVFSALKESMNTIWEVKPKPNLGIWGFIRSRLLTFGMVLVIGVLMLASLLVTTVFAALNSYIVHTLGVPGFVSVLFAFVVPLILETLMFAMIFKLLPDAQVKWTNVWIGAFFTAVLFEIGKSLLSWYLGQASTTSSFGAAGSLVLLLLWVYYASLILFFGAEFTEVWARATGHVIQPAHNAQKVTPEERIQEGLEPEVVPHPSAAAAMAGRDPNTGVRSGGDHGHPKRHAEAEPHPLTPDRHVPDAPRKERLAPVRENPEEWPVPAMTARREHEEEGWVESANHHPITEVGVALGFGLLMGMISRIAEARMRNVSAGEHFRLGARAAAAAGAAALVSAGPRVKKAMNQKAVKGAVTSTVDRIRTFGKELPERVETVIR